jgi:hypothetical protein
VLTTEEKKGLLKLEPKDSATGVEKQFVKALKTPQIIQRPIEDLVDVIKFVMMKVGVRNENLPSDIETRVLLDHIVNYYGSHTHEEFKLAFELAITDRLVFPEKQDAQHYENFSCAYVSKIMNAYRVWAGKTYKEIVKPEKKEPEKEDLNNKTMQDWWNDVSKRVRHEGMKYHFVSLQLFDWAKKNSLIENSGIKKSAMMKLAVETRILELMAKFKTEPTSEVKKELEDFQRMDKFSLVEAYYVESVKAVAKKLMVYEMMKKETDEAHQD